MKKRRLISIAALVPFALLTACGSTPSLAFAPTWYADTTTSNITGTDERLEYGIKFKSNNGEFRLSYDDDEGTYVTTLKDVPYTDANGETSLVYQLHSELRITGRYIYGDEIGPDFEDTMVSDVTFRRIADGFSPLESKKVVHSTVPAANPEHGNLCVTYEYTFETIYAPDLSSADYTLEIAAPEAEKKTSTGNIELNEDGTYLDNEQIAFALRGADLSAASYFSSIDPQTRQLARVSYSAPVATDSDVSFLLNGTQINEHIAIEQVSLTYTMDNPGPQRTFVYAATTDAKNNRFRNVLLSFENDVIRSLGTMTYTLKSATFGK